ncbi:hypothetical protein HKX48_003203 [Thoreauomyces humboldtii]|nr:hypothetical protein HKX48_003203 [Thoreauomyces humboldtii]
MSTTDIPQRLNKIRDSVKAAQATRHSSSGAKEVTLVAVSKTKPAADLLEAYNAGQRHFGENIQELVDKAAELPQDIHWHFIGTLQSNKCKLVASIPNLWAVETIDSAKKADTMNRTWDAADATRSPLRVFVQVNTSGESSKSGVDPGGALDVAEHIFKECKSLVLQGLMTIGSPDRDPEAENPDFKVHSRV